MSTVPRFALQAARPGVTHRQLSITKVDQQRGEGRKNWQGRKGGALQWVGENPSPSEAPSIHRSSVHAVSRFDCYVVQQGGAGRVSALSTCVSIVIKFALCSVPSGIRPFPFPNCVHLGLTSHPSARLVVRKMPYSRKVTTLMVLKRPPQITSHHHIHPSRPSIQSTHIQSNFPPKDTHLDLMPDER